MRRSRRSGGRGTARESFRDGSRGDDWITGTKLLVDAVVRTYAELDMAALRDYVETQTGPMADAVVGEPLQLARARDDRRRPPRKACKRLRGPPRARTRPSRKRSSAARR